MKFEQHSSFWECFFGRVTYLGVEFMEDVLEVVTLNWFFRVEKLEEILDELQSDIDLEGADLNGLIDNQLEEEFIDTLEVGPCWIHLFFLLHACLGETKVRFLHIGQGSEDVLFDHLHHFV